MEWTMYRLAFPVALLLLGSACSKYYYVELLDGKWVGVATDGQGGEHPMYAEFKFDEEADQQFTGTVDLDGWIYLVEGATSDKKAADIELYNELGVRDAKLTKVKVEDEDMKGDYTETTADGEVTGSFSLSMQ
ncbi:MAG: hypothetical protein R3F59_09975 [Myxococcota bacterium]